MFRIIKMEDVRRHVSDTVTNDLLGDYIADIEARAAEVAPCIFDPLFERHDAARATLRAAVIRRAEYGAGEVSTEAVTNGPFQASQTVDTRRFGPTLLTQREERELRALCADSGAGQRRRAFTVLPGRGVIR